MSEETCVHCGKHPEDCERRECMHIPLRRVFRGLKTGEGPQGHAATSPDVLSRQSPVEADTQRSTRDTHHDQINDDAAARLLAAFPTKELPMEQVPQTQAAEYLQKHEEALLSAGFVEAVDILHQIANPKGNL